MRSSALLTSSLLASVVAKDAPTLLGRPGSNATTGWCHPGYAQAINATSGHNRCIACPAGTHSQGGVSSTCTAMADDWVTCSHLACELVDSTRHCNFHSSANPRLALEASASSIGQHDCHDVGDHNTSVHGEHHAGVQRISIFHHGSEQHGMEHKCSKNTGGVNGARGDCECKCKRGFDYLSTPTETVETTMSVGGFTEATFTEHAQFAVQTAIAADLGVDVTHVTISNIQYSTDGGLTWFDVSVASGDRRLTEVQKKIRFDVEIKVDAGQAKTDIEVKVNAIAAEPAAQEMLVQKIEQVMVVEHISTEDMDLSVACEEFKTPYPTAFPTATPTASPTVSCFCRRRSSLDIALLSSVY
jgi:hypothetical protein